MKNNELGNLDRRLHKIDSMTRRSGPAGENHPAGEREHRNGGRDEAGTGEPATVDKPKPEDHEGAERLKAKDSGEPHGEREAEAEYQQAERREQQPGRGGAHGPGEPVAVSQPAAEAGEGAQRVQEPYRYEQPSVRDLQQKIQKLTSENTSLGDEVRNVQENLRLSIN